MSSKKKKINVQALLEAVSYIAFMLLMLNLVISGKYKMYVTARMIPYFYFTAGILFIWTVYSISRMFRPGYKNRIYHTLVLLIPVLLFFLPHGLIKESNFAAPTPKDTMIAEAAAENSFENKDGEKQNNLIPGLSQEDKLIYVTDEDFGFWYTLLATDGKKYEGYTIKIGGSVLKNSDFMADNEFMISRLLMTCCAADVAPGGIVCQYDQSPQLKQGDWYRVEGILEVESKGSYDVPTIKVTSIEPMEPVEGYAYP